MPIETTTAGMVVVGEELSIPDWPVNATVQKITLVFHMDNNMDVSFDPLAEVDVVTQ